MRLRKGKKCFTRAAGREEREHGREAALQMPKSGKKEAEKAKKGRIMVKAGCCSTAHEDSGTANIQQRTVPPMEDTAGGHALKKAEVHRGSFRSSFLAGAAAHREDQITPEDCIHGKDL